MEKHYRELVWESYEKSKRIATEGSLIGNEDTFAWNLCGINTKESGKFSFKMWIKNSNSLNYIITMTQKETVKTSVHLETM